MSKLAGVPRQVLAQNAVRVSATAQGINRPLILCRTSSLTISVHGPIKSKYVALSGQALKQNASLAQMELQARLGEREFVALAAYSVFPHQHVTVYPPATALVSSDASDYVTKTAEPVSELEAVNRIRESKGLPPLVPKLGQNAQRRENKRLAKQIAQEEDLKYAHNDQDWADLGTTESGSSSEDDSNSDSPSSMEEELALGETPMGREFIRSRALRAYELPPPVEVFDRWRNGVEEHLFLHRNSQYARNQVYWPDISALPVGVDDDFAHQEANSNVFEQRRALIQRSEEDWTLENDHFRRTSLQSPSPGRREI
jgi:hypothetical protein